MGCVPVLMVPSGTREIIEPALSGLLVRLNSDAVAAAIAALSPAQLSAMSAAAARRSRTLFCATAGARDLQLADDLVRCRDLVHRARLPAPVAPLIASSRSYSPIARLYHALPAALRHQIRNALTAYPASFRWLREKSEAGLKPYPAESEESERLTTFPDNRVKICRESAAARARRRRRARTGGARGHHNAGHGLRLIPRYRMTPTRRCDAKFGHRAGRRLAAHSGGRSRGARDQARAESAKPAVGRDRLLALGRPRTRSLSDRGDDGRCRDGISGDRNFCRGGFVGGAVRVGGLPAGFGVSFVSS